MNLMMKNFFLLAGFLGLLSTPLFAQCDLQDIQPENIACNDNGTPNEDFTQFSIQPGGNSLGPTYSVTATLMISGHFHQSGRKSIRRCVCRR
jgi:hypothetical protein